MISPMIDNLLYAVVFIVLGALIGTSFVLMSTGYIHRITDKITPNIDEDKEILRGNLAVAQYHGRVVAATIIGVSIVVASAVMAGVLSALHG